MWYSLLLLGYKPVQHITVLNTVGAGPSGRAVFGRSPAEIVGSNPTRGMDICLL